MTRRSDNLQEVREIIQEQVVQELEKRATKPETYQFNRPPFYNLSVQAGNKPKPEGKVSYTALRNFSIHYPIARACIDYLKTKLIKLDYQIVSEDENETLKPGDPRVKVVEDFFRHPLGMRTSFRQLIEPVIEDYLVIGAFSLERMRTRGGQFLNELKLVDSSTVQIMIDDYGRLPIPPQIAYRQIVNGSIVAELTSDELLYVPRGYRTNSPYGLSPIESIIIQAESALQGALYSLRYYTDGNIPEGFGEMPEGWSTDKIREFQDYFDALIAGNPVTQRRIKMVPKGFNYLPTKKPDALGFEKFEGWLLQQTCAVFGVPPHDIGFNTGVYKQDGESQQELGEERGMRPLAQQFEQVFTDIIQTDMNFPGLKFRYKDLDPVNMKEEAEVQEIKIRSGVISVDEARSDEGLDPIGLGNYIQGTPVLAETLINPPEPEASEPQSESDQSLSEEMNVTSDAQKIEIKTWKKQSKNAYRQGRDFKRFASSVLDEWMIDEIFDQLQEVKKREDIDIVFSPYLDDSMHIIKSLQKLTDAIGGKNKTTG